MRSCRFNGGRAGLWRDGQVVDEDGVTLDPASLRYEPAVVPGRILGFRANYAGTGERELPPEQRLFVKPTASLAGVGVPLTLRLPARRTDHEVELVAVIGQVADRLPSAARAIECVAGYCIGLDFGLRGDEDRSLRKSLDGYTVLGPWFVSADEVGSADDLAIELDVNGEPRQRGRTRDMRTPVAELVALASQYFALQPGDLLYTGSPPGVGPVAAGDLLEARIERLGKLTLHVAPEGSAAGLGVSA